MITLLNKSEIKKNQVLTDNDVPMRYFRNNLEVKITYLECRRKAVCFDRFPIHSQSVSKQKMSIPKSLDAVAR